MNSRATLPQCADDSGIPSPTIMSQHSVPGTIAIHTARRVADIEAVVLAVEMLQTRKLKPDQERIHSYFEKHFPQEVQDDPTLVERLINEALAQSLIVSVNNLTVLSFRTPSKIGRMLRVTKIVAWEGEVPQSVVMEVLKVIGEVEEAAPDSTEESPKGIGVSVKEMLDKLHNDLRLLNYNAKIITDKVMPIAIGEGLAKLLPRGFYTLTDQYRGQFGITLKPSSVSDSGEGSGSQNYEQQNNNNNNNHHHHFSGEEDSPGTSPVVVKPVRTSKSTKRDSSGSNCSNSNSSSGSSSSSSHHSKNNTADKISDFDLSPGVKSVASSSSSSYSSATRRRPRPEDDDEEEGEEDKMVVDDTNNGNDGEEDTTEGGNADVEMESTASEVEGKEVANDDSSKSPEVKDVSNVPQRFSTRKRFKKSLGPDFVDSSDQMSYYMNQPNASAKCGMCNAALVKGKPSILGRKNKQQGGSNDKQELDKSLIQCSKCELKVHISCLLLKEQIGSKSQWKCAACGVCSVCSTKSKKKEFIISCSTCKRGFHTCCTAVGQTSHDNTTWQCAHCVEPARQESASQSVDSAKPKMSMSIKPIGKHITPTIITGNGTIASSKSLLPKTSTPSVTSSNAKAQHSKVNGSNSVNHSSKETTLLLPKPTNNEAPASNSLLMPVPSMNSQSSTTIKAIRPSSNIIPSDAKKTSPKKKLKKKCSVGAQKTDSEILFRKAERPQNHAESSSTMNGSTESSAKVLPSSKKVKKLKLKLKSTIKLQQQSLIKPAEKPAGTPEVKEEVDCTNHVTLLATNSSPNSILSPPPPPPQTLSAQPISPLPQPEVQQNKQEKRPRFGPSIKLIFGEDSCPELKHNFMAWISCELKHLVKFDPNPFSSLSYDVPKWSPQDVSDFFSAVGLTSSAKFALDNQVDGMSLLLLQRQDILTRFPMQMGPALKLHAFIDSLRREFDLY